MSALLLSILLSLQPQAAQQDATPQDINRPPCAVTRFWAGPEFATWAIAHAGDFPGWYSRKAEWRFAIRPLRSSKPLHEATTDKPYTKWTPSRAGYLVVEWEFWRRGRDKPLLAGSYLTQVSCWPEARWVA